jgi:hypothetical protein
MTVDLRQWTAAARSLHETSSRSAVDFINGQAMKVSSLSIKETKFADPRKIEHELGAVARSISFKVMSRGKNKGKTRTVRGDYVLANDDTLAQRILIARRIKTGKYGVPGNLLADKARNLIKARVAAINFIRAGWIPAFKQLSLVVRQRPVKAKSVQGVVVKGKPKGRATPARFSLRSVIAATIENSALNKKPVYPETKGNPMRYAREGLQKALNLSAKDMVEELARRLNPDFKKVSAK